MFKRIYQVRKRFHTKDLFYHNLNYYVLNGILFAFTSAMAKSYTPKFLDRIGGNAFAFTLYNALPGAIAIFATLPMMLWITRVDNIKRVMERLFFQSRIFLLFFALIPFLPLTIQPITFVIMASVMNLPETASATALQSYSADVFEESKRTRAISARQKFQTLTTMLVTLVIGILLTTGEELKLPVIPIYQILFFMAFLVGIGEINTFHRMIHEEKEVRKVSIKQQLAEVFQGLKKNKPLLSFFACSALFYFGWQMGWPLFNIYQIKILGANEAWLAILNTTSNATMFFCFGYWKKKIDHRGTAYVLAITTLGMSISPILFAISPNLVVLTIMGIITGFFTSGTITVLYNTLLEVSPEQDRAVYIGLHVTLTNITLAISPFIGNYFYSHWGIYVALILTAGFRLLGSASFYIRNVRIDESL